jgi:hypothetical protein
MRGPGVDDGGRMRSRGPIVVIPAGTPSRVGAVERNDARPGDSGNPGRRRRNRELLLLLMSFAVTASAYAVLGLTLGAALLQEIGTVGAGSRCSRSLCTW